MKSQLIRAFQAKIQYTFKNESLLRQAMTHRSHGTLNNERLEFLGDAILGSIIGSYLFAAYPDAPEGVLSRMKIHLVCGHQLAKISKNMRLNEHMIVGEGERKSGIVLKRKLLEDVFEALIGALYLDSNYACVESMVLKWYAPYFEKLTLMKDLKDAKTQLQEWCQSHQYVLPSYEVVHVDGPEDSPTYVLSCTLASLQISSKGVGLSRKKAEQNAAKIMLELLEKQHLLDWN